MTPDMSPGLADGLLDAIAMTEALMASDTESSDAVAGFMDRSLALASYTSLTLRLAQRVGDLTGQSPREVLADLREAVLVESSGRG